jgi:hypothetical protein
VFSECLCVAIILSANVGAHKTFYERKLIKVVKRFAVFMHSCTILVPYRYSTYGNSGRASECYIYSPFRIKLNILRAGHVLVGREGHRFCRQILSSDFVHKTFLL